MDNESSNSDWLMLALLCLLLISRCSTQEQPRVPPSSVSPTTIPITTTLPTFSPVPTMTIAPSITPSPTARNLGLTLPSAIETEVSRTPPPYRDQFAIKRMAITREFPENIEAYLNLDRSGPAIQKGDIKFSIVQEESWTFYLEFVNGSSGLAIEDNIAGFEGCMNLEGSYLKEKYLVQDVLHKYLCVLTNEHQISLVFVDNAELIPINVSTLRIIYVTWMK